MKVHLIGIAGTGMGSLAGLLKAAGHDVRGSDEHVYPPMSTQLAEQQIPVFEGFGPANLDWAPDAVVVGNVCRKDHVEVLAAQERKIPLESFPSLFGKLFLDSPNKRSLVVAGTHGKTTTSSLLAQVLSDAGRDPSFLIGGVPLNFRQSWRLGAGGSIVIEADEARCWLKVYRGRIIETLDSVPPFGFTFKLCGSRQAWEDLFSGKRRLTDLVMPGRRRFENDPSLATADGSAPAQIVIEGNMLEATRIHEALYHLADCMARSAK